MSESPKYYEITMCRDPLVGYPKPPLPEGFSLRLYKPGDKETWVSIQDEADTLNAITPKLFHDSFGTDETLIAQRQLYLCDSQGTSIGTSTGWSRERNGESWGRVHWVAIRPEFQGRGLAKPLISATLSIIEQLGHDKVYLSTATPRLPAINLYLSQGFLPERHSEEDIVAWEEVARWIKLP
jgi:ribosomal protein S18 acetylase RimI-like enzyme